MSRIKVAMKTRASGQAMVEMLVIAGVLTALFIGTWYLGKFHDIQSSTIQAARYAAWERTARAPSFTNTQLESQTRARLFTRNQSAYKAVDGKPNGSSWTTAEQDAQWADIAGTKRIVDRPANVSVTTASGALPGRGANAMSTVIGSIGSTIGAVTGGEALNQGGLYTSNVSVQLTDIGTLSSNFLPAGVNSLNLTLNEKSALVTDSWDASGAAQTARRTRSFTPAGIFSRIDGLLAPITWALSIIEPAFSDFKPGQICADIVPADRITGGGNLPAYRGGGACN